MAHYKKSEYFVRNEDNICSMQSCTAYVSCHEADTVGVGTVYHDITDMLLMILLYHDIIDMFMILLIMSWCNSLFNRDVRDQVNDSVAIAEFIIILRNQLHKIRIKLNASFCVKNRRMRIAHKIRRNDL